MQKRQALVAVIDDDLGIRKSLEALLNAFGYRVVLYESAEHLLSAKLDETPACLIVDINLPDITGIELARQLLAGGVKLPTIFISGSTDPSWRRKAIELGCVACIAKPFSPQVLSEALASATGPNPFFEE
jgi:FixJ family two-component response regulator